MASQFTFAQPCKAPQVRMEVILGSHTIKAFVTAPKEFQVLGIVRMGLEFGLLAKTAGGHYVRINGSNIQTLCSAEVNAALFKASTWGRGESFAETRVEEALQPAARPQVTLRKCRKVDPLLTSTSTWARHGGLQRAAVQRTSR